MIHKFSTTDTPPIDRVGGKALSLIEATRAGFPVPDGIVLDVDFFRDWLGEIERGEAWAVFLGAPDDELRLRCDAVKTSCRELRLAENLREALESAVRELSAEGLFAVRSSSPEEDLEGSSFAGGYETTLGVTRAGLEEAIRHSFVSVFDERVVRYKRQRGVRADQPRIAVIVQRQLASDASGVAFSLNPLNNCYDEAVINGNFGLGESVVSGLVTPDTFIVEKTRHEILERRIVDKSHVVRLNTLGGTVEGVNEDARSASLSDPEALAVAELTARAETHYGRPVDIEWALEDETLYLLQSRPVTTHLPLPEEMVTRPGEHKNLYLDVIVLSQGFSDSLSVLGGEYWGRMVEAVKGETMFDRGMDGTLLNIAGRQYLHLSNMMKGLGAGIMPKLLQTYDTPTRKIFGTIELKRDYLPGKKPAAVKGMRGRVLKRVVSMLPVIIRGLRETVDAPRLYEQRAATAAAECRRLASEGRPFDQLADEFLARFAGLMETMVGVMVPPMLARWRLRRLFRDDDVEDLLIALEMDLQGNPTSEMGHRMYELASFPEVQSTADGEEFARKLESRGYSPELMDAYESYLDKFGCRGIKEIDVATPRCYEDLPAFFEQLRAIDVTNDTIKTAKERRSKAYDELLAIAARKGKKERFERLVRQHLMAGFREAPKYFFIITVDLLRRRALELGARFVEEGRLESVNQVFDLRIEEIARAEREFDLDVLALVARNLEPRKKLKHVKSWPRVIDSRGKIFRAPPGDSEDGFVGDAIAPGVVIGKAKVLHAPYEKPLRKGEILVTRASDPGWTPIFINAAGIVLEVGGALQHGAVIAREYGLPCVSGLDGITETIRDGQIIEVDGSAGVVRLVLDEEQTA